MFVCSGAVAGNWCVYQSDTKLLGHRWTVSNLIRLAFWSALAVRVPLVLFSFGAESIQLKDIGGVVWIFLAGTMAFVAMIKLRHAEGIKPRDVKSGELYKRAKMMAKRIGVRLDWVSIIPFGRGRLTNAFGGWRGIAATDDYSRWLHDDQLDFVVGHELAHVQTKHGLKRLAVVGATYPISAIAGMLLPGIPGVWIVVHHFSVILLPLLTCYAISRRFEYNADRLALKFSGIDGEQAVAALVSLYQRTGAPTRYGRFEELFQTHPSLWSRIAAIASVTPVSAESVTKVRNELG